MDTKPDFRPPYNAFRTFWGFIDTLASKPLPPQIDRSMLDSKSGTDQMGLNFALQGFGLIASDEDKRAVQPLLRELVDADPEGRKVILAALLKQYYPKQVGVSASNGTEDMLLDSFKDDFGYTGDTRRKAATWLLHAMTEAGLPVSPHFPKLRPGGAVSGSRRPRSPRKPRGGAGAAVPRPEPEPPTDVVPGDTFTVELQAGGTVTLQIRASHFALSRNKTDRKFVEGLIDALTEYEAGAADDDEPDDAED